MIEKLKAFFANKTTKTVEVIILALTSAGLIFGGVSTADISKVVTLAEGVIVAVVALATFISNLVNKKEDKE